MKGGNGLIKNEKELQKSWDKKEKETGRFLIQSWLAKDGMGTEQRYYREDITYKDLKDNLQYYFKNERGSITEEHY